MSDIRYRVENDNLTPIQVLARLGVHLIAEEDFQCGFILMVQVPEQYAETIELQAALNEVQLTKILGGDDDEAADNPGPAREDLPGGGTVQTGESSDEGEGES